MRLMLRLDATWWGIPLLIIAVAVLAGLAAWLPTLHTHTACHLTVITTGGRPRMLPVCP